jgi:hypothetical protein
MFITFLPVIVFCGVIWGFLWAVILRLLWRAANQALIHGALLDFLHMA